MEMEEMTSHTGDRVATKAHRALAWAGAQQVPRKPSSRAVGGWDNGATKTRGFFFFFLLFLVVSPFLELSCFRHDSLDLKPESFSALPVPTSLSMPVTQSLLDWSESFREKTGLSHVGMWF